MGPSPDSKSAVPRAPSRDAQRLRDGLAAAAKAPRAQLEREALGMVRHMIELGFLLPGDAST